MPKEILPQNNTKDTLNNKYIPKYTPEQLKELEIMRQEAVTALNTGV